MTYKTQLATKDPIRIIVHPGTAEARPILALVPAERAAEMATRPLPELVQYALGNDLSNSEGQTGKAVTTEMTEPYTIEVNGRVAGKTDLASGYLRQATAPNGMPCQDLDITVARAGSGGYSGLAGKVSSAYK